MDCDVLKKKMKELENQINSLNAAEIRSRREISSGKTPQDVRDILIHQHGLPAEVADTITSSATGWEPDQIKLMAASEEIANNAMAFKKEAQSTEASQVSPTFLKQAAQTFREKFMVGLERSFNARVKGANPALERSLFSFATDKDMMEVSPGSGVYAGRNVRRMIDREVNNLHTSSGTKLDIKKFRVGLEAAAEFGRGEDALADIKKEKALFESNLEENPSGKVELRRLELAEQVFKETGVQDYLKEVYRKLDVIKDKYFPDEKGVNGYYPNRVILEPHLDIWDSLTSGDRRSFSRISGEKKHKNSFEAYRESGIRGASDDFVENQGQYWSAVANKIRKQHLSEKFRENADLHTSHPDKMMIDISSDASEAAFKTKGIHDKERPKTADGREYREMGNLGAQFDGILVHPEVYAWQERVFRQIKPDGFADKALKGMKMWRTIVLNGASVIHGGSLAKKYAYMYASMGLKEGLNTFLSPKSTILNALATMDQNSPKFATTLKLFQNGLSLDTYDMSRNAAFARKYNEAGNQTMLSTVSEKIADFSDWQHKWLFEKFRTGLKLDMGHRILESDWFSDKLKNNHKGDYNAAMKEVTTIINDHFGGQNLEAIGRSRIVQSFMQGMLLSPEWTEAKLKRTYGAFINPSDTIRNAHKWSLIAEMGTMVIAKVALQQVYNAMYPDDQRSMEQMADDIFKRRLASLYIGTEKIKSKDKNGKTITKEKEIFSNFGQSENQDLGLLIPFVKGAYDSFATGDATQIPKQFAKEMAHKLGPAPKAIIETMARHTPEKEMGWGAKTYETAKSALPIGVSQVVDAAEGNLGHQAGKRTIQSLAGSLSGIPLTAYNKENPKKEEQKKKSRTMRLVK